MHHWGPRLLALALFVTLNSVSAKAGIRVVSDLDDTTKITNVGDPLSAIINGLFSTRSFVGMRELYTSLAQSRGYAFNYLTGTPEFLRFRAEKFLRVGNFPVGEIHLKPVFGSESLGAYKLRIVSALLKRYPDDQFILVGDDTQVDFEVYDEVFRSYPDRVLAIYIRKVTNRPLPPSAYPFLSAFDVARTEFLMGRMSVDQAAPVATVILNEPRTSLIIPRFSYCPVNLLFLLEPQMEEWNQKIDERIHTICRARED